MSPHVTCDLFHKTLSGQNGDSTYAGDSFVSAARLQFRHKNIFFMLSLHKTYNIHTHGRCRIADCMQRPVPCAGRDLTTAQCDSLALPPGILIPL